MFNAYTITVYLYKNNVEIYCSHTTQLHKHTKSVQYSDKFKVCSNNIELFIIKIITIYIKNVYNILTITLKD